MQCATVVDPNWLAEMGPMFFSIREGGQTRAEKRKKEREHKQKMEAEHQMKIEIELLETEQKRLKQLSKLRVVEIGAQSSSKPKKKRFGM